MAKRRLPPSERMNKPLMGFRVNAFTVGDWCPTPDGSGPAQAVAVSLNVQIEADVDAEFVWKLRTPADVDTLIQSLLRHKRSVWPDAP